MFTTKYTKKQGGKPKKVKKFAEGGSTSDRTNKPLPIGTPGTWSDLSQASGGGSGDETMLSAEARRRRRLQERN